jgi:murein endopeptidase
MHRSWSTCCVLVIAVALAFPVVAPALDQPAPADASTDDPPASPAPADASADDPSEPSAPVGASADHPSTPPVGADASADDPPAPPVPAVVEDVPAAETKDAASKTAADSERIGADLPQDAEAWRRVVREAPDTLGSLSIGTPDGGALINGVQMPDGPLWHVRNPREAWGTSETIQYLQAAIETVEKAHPGSPPLCIGDVSRREGGHLKRHRSHQAGRDVDVGLYYASGKSADFRNGSPSQLDLPRCWALVRALITETDVEWIFVDRSIQRALFDHALKNGENREWLERILQIARGRRDATVRHLRGHKNHFHVRFFNPRAQEWARLAYPYLAEAGLAPPAVVVHLARNGDTLSTIAHRYGSRVSAIRAANGLSSNRIRAGRRYRVPVRGIAPRVSPVVVPPRRLPPSAEPVANSTRLQTPETPLL